MPKVERGKELTVVCRVHRDGPEDAEGEAQNYAADAGLLARDEQARVDLLVVALVVVRFFLFLDGSGGCCVVVAAGLQVFERAHVGFDLLEDFPVEVVGLDVCDERCQDHRAADGHPGMRGVLLATDGLSVVGVVAGYHRLAI